MANIKELAKISGYSVGTISKALNDYPDISEKTRDKIKKLAQEIGYMPSSFGKSLVTKKSYSIGIVFEEQSGFGLSHPFFGEILSVIKDELEKYGYDLLLMNKHIGNFVNSYLQHCIQKGVDGVIVLSADLDTKNYNELVSSNIPMVLIDLKNESKSCVYTNNYESTKLAVKYIADLNHKEIGYVKGDLHRLTGSQRYLGYLDAMKDCKLEVNDEFVFHAPNYTIEEGYKIGEEISKLKVLPSAVLCVCDAVAIGLINGLADNGIIVPDDMSVMGFDDINLSRIVRPQLTTISQNKNKIGRNAVIELINQITNKKTTPIQIVIDGELVVRNSVKEKCS